MGEWVSGCVCVCERERERCTSIVSSINLMESHGSSEGIPSVSCRIKLVENTRLGNSLGGKAIWPSTHGEDLANLAFK